MNKNRWNASRNCVVIFEAVKMIDIEANVNINGYMYNKINFNDK